MLQTKERQKESTILFSTEMHFALGSSQYNKALSSNAKIISILDCSVLSKS